MSIIQHPSAVTQDSLPASAPPRSGRPWYLRKIDAVCHARAIEATLQAAETALAIDDPQRKPADYRELAEEILGRLDPHVRAVAEYRAWQTVYAQLIQTTGGPRQTDAQRAEAVRIAVVKGLIHYQMTCSGHLPVSFTDAERVRDGRVI
jgi:hypothetical protein